MALHPDDAVRPRSAVARTNRAALIFVVGLVAVVVLGVVGVSLVDTDDAATVSSLEAEPGPERSPDRASEVCKEHGPAIGRMTLSYAGSTTAGEVVDVKRALGQSPAPWDAFPDDHYVARCAYVDRGDSSPTTVCANGDAVETTEPVQFLVDDHGTITPDIQPPATDYCGD